MNEINSCSLKYSPSRLFIQNQTVNDCGLLKLLVFSNTAVWRMRLALALNSYLNKCSLLLWLRRIVRPCVACVRSDLISKEEEASYLWNEWNCVETRPRHMATQPPLIIYVLSFMEQDKQAFPFRCVVSAWSVNPTTQLRIELYQAPPPHQHTCTEWRQTGVGGWGGGINVFTKIKVEFHCLCTVFVFAWVIVLSNDDIEFSDNISLMRYSEALFNPHGLTDATSGG